LANGLLAHNATDSRNKLAEIVLTRRKLWRALAQKENAELAAAARSNFIASASHEIRTPLHHLQGYSDLLSKAKLSDDARQLVLSIQNATKSLSLSKLVSWRFLPF
jgi:signal transduction histidine kinase